MGEPNARKRFEVRDYGQPYQPSERPEPWFRLLEELSSNLEACGPCDHRLYITADAMTQLRSHVRWGESADDNRVEQGGLMLGHSYTDASAHVVYGVVSDIVPGRSALGSDAHLSMRHAVWKEMLEEAEDLRGRYHQRSPQVIGWYHTHPNDLSVFMSATDRETQSRLFAHEWQFAVVLNPQQKIWRAFYGAGAAECPGIVVLDAEGEPQTGDEGVEGAGAVFEKEVRFADGVGGEGGRDGVGRYWIYPRRGATASGAGTPDPHATKLLLVAVCLLLLLFLMQTVGLYLQVRTLLRRQ